MYGREDIVAPEDRLLTTRDVSTLLAGSEAVVRSMTSDGRLVSVKFGKAVRFRRRDVDAFIHAAASFDQQDARIDSTPEEVTVPATTYIVAAAGERIDVRAESFEILTSGTLVFREADGSYVAIFAPDEWQWINRPTTSQAGPAAP